MFCEKCGTKLEDGSLFCDNCGAKLADKPMVSPTVEVVPQVQQETAQGYQQVPYQQIPQGYQSVPVVPRQPMAKSTKFFLVEAILLIALIIIGFKVGQSRFSADYVAENYAKAKMTGDWDAVYEMLNLPNSELLTKELFLATRTDVKLQEIANYEIEENEYNSNKFRASYTCEYMTSGDRDSNSEEIVLVKQRDKQWLLFDKWEVTPDNMLCEDVSITVPIDAKILINGIDIGAMKSVESEENYGNLTYILPEMFRGTYTVEVQAPGRKTYSETVDIEYYFSKSYTSLEPDTVVMEELAAVNEELYSAMWTAIMDGKSYDDFLAEHSEKFVEGIDFRYYYENWLYEFENNEYYQYRKITIDEMNAGLDYYGCDYETGEFYIRMNQSGNMYYEGLRTYTDWWTNEVTYESFDGSRNFYGCSTFALQNGEWIITNFGN